MQGWQTMESQMNLFWNLFKISFLARVVAPGVTLSPSRETISPSHSEKPYHPLNFSPRETISPFHSLNQRNSLTISHSHPEKPSRLQRFQSPHLVNKYLAVNFGKTLSYKENITFLSTPGSISLQLSNQLLRPQIGHVRS